MHRMVGLAAALALAACGGSGGDGDGGKGKDRDRRVDEASAQLQTGGSQVCRADGGLRPLPDEVHEASGAAPSRRNAGVFWTHNDSGDPVVYAIDASGALAGRVRIAGAQVQDWEDIAVGPCGSAGGDCLYVADIGDNQAARPSVTVYRVPEPAPGDAESRPAEAIQLRYPDGAQDAEAMFVLPDGRIHIVSKGETGPIALYRAPADAAPGRTAQLERVRELAASEQKRSERVTGASASPDGRWLAVRTLRSLSIYPVEGFVAGSGAPREMDLRELKEAQGEGVGFALGGTVILTSEGGKKKDNATFARLTCTLE